MAKRKKKNSKDNVWDSMTAESFQSPCKDIHAVMPKQFLIGLRLAIESGMTFQEITSTLILHSALKSIAKHVPQNEIVTRTQTIVNVIKEDIRLSYRSDIQQKLKAADRWRSGNEVQKND